MLQNVQLALAAIIALIALVHIIPLINPIFVATIAWIFGIMYYLLVVTPNVYAAGGLPLLWYFFKLSFTDNV